MQIIGSSVDSEAVSRIGNLLLTRMSEGFDISSARGACFPFVALSLAELSVSTAGIHKQLDIPGYQVCH